jgi:hypothetical protein
MVQMMGLVGVRWRAARLPMLVIERQLLGEAVENPVLESVPERL